MQEYLVVHRTTLLYRLLIGYKNNYMINFHLFNEINQGITVCPIYK